MRNTKRQELPLIHIRDAVIYPGTRLPLIIGRAFTIRAIELSLQKHRGKVIALTQKRMQEDRPNPRSDCFEIGCLAKITHAIKLTDGTMKILVVGEKPIRLDSIREHDGARFGSGKLLPSLKLSNSPLLAEDRKRTLDLLVRWNPAITFEEKVELFNAIREEKSFDPFLSMALQLSANSILMGGQHVIAGKKLSRSFLLRANEMVSRRQKLLEITEPMRRLRALQSLLTDEARLAEKWKA